MASGGQLLSSCPTLRSLDKQLQQLQQRLLDREELQADELPGELQSPNHGELPMVVGEERGGAGGKGERQDERRGIGKEKGEVDVGHTYGIHTYPAICCCCCPDN